MTPDRDRLLPPKINRSREEVGRAVFDLLDEYEVLEAVDAGTDLQLFASDVAALSGRDAVLAPKQNRSRAEVGRAVFDLADSHESVFLTAGDSPFDVQLFVPSH